MHFRIVLAALVLSSLGARSAWAQVPASAPLHTFYGEVKAIDLAARTITIKTHVRSFVFHITDETKISSPNEHISWDKVQRGQGATVVMRLGQGGIGVAVAIRFDANASFTKHLALYSARTMQGEMISGLAVNNFVAYQPPDIGFVRGLDLGPNKMRMFRLAVRPDGTVESATPYVSFGVEELDARAVKWLKKWRFRPNSVTEVRLPMGFYQTRR
jgi:TonB family protein